MKHRITELTIYRYRYFIGYMFVGLAVLLVLLASWRFVPGALTQNEMQASITSGSLSVKNFQPNMVVDLPYHLLQRASFKLFGVSTLSIKLPSLLIGIGTAIGLLLLLRLWFRRSVAIPTVAMAITLPQFIYLSQSGTPAIMFSFLSIWLLLAATVVAWRLYPTSRLTQPALFTIGSLTLYTPLGIYLILTLLTTLLFHPRIRFLVKQLSVKRLIGGGVIAGIVLLPLVYATIRDHKVLLTLLGVPTQLPDFSTNALTVLHHWFDFFAVANSEIITPIYPIGITLLMLLGLYRLVVVRYTARSYITWVWMALLVPIILINPRMADASFLLFVLLLARGVSQLLVNWWYRLFPRNPYARIAGLVPVAIIILGIIFSSAYRYMYTYLYSPPVLAHFSEDLRVLEQEVARNAHKGPVAVVVSQDEAPFYRLVDKYNTTYTVTTSLTTPEKNLIVSRAAREQLLSTIPYDPRIILTTDRAAQSDRFYVYLSGK